MDNYRVFGSKSQYELLFPEYSAETKLKEECWREEPFATSPIMSKVAEEQQKALIPLKEDLADWLSKLLGRKFHEDTLLDDLETGSVLCELANIICRLAFSADESDERNKNRPKSAHVSSCAGRPISVQSVVQKGLLMALPTPPRYKASAQPRSFLARDNAANFIVWCRQLGVDESCMFESECLVLQKQPRNVILCLLDVARIAARHGLIAPELVALEEEIEIEEMELIKQAQPSEASPLSTSLKARAKVLKLDDAVHHIVDGPPFDGQIDIERVGEGRYRIEGKLLFVRMLRGRHVMVRVGGGWDTLEHYLIKHDPSHFIAKISAKEICDSLARDLTISKPASARSSAISRATMGILKSADKGYFVPVGRRPNSALHK